MKKTFFTAAAMLLVCHAAEAHNDALRESDMSESGRVYYYSEEELADTSRQYEMEKIEISATRAGKKTPVAYSDISKESISKVNYGQDIPYLLTLTPSVVATSDAGAGIGYTGVRIRGVDATRINVTSNGVPMNDAESHGMFWVNVPDIASSVEDIQVQRGVGTSTNGAGAFGGSINLRTETPSIAPSAEASFSYGSYNTHKEMVKVSTGLINNRWAFTARMSNLHSDGYIDRASTDLKSWFAQGGYYGNKTVVKLLAFGGREKTYHAWDGISRFQMEENRRYNPCGEIEELVVDGAGRPVLKDGKRQYAHNGKYYDGQTDNYIQNHYQLIVNQQLAPGWKLNATLHYTTGDGYYEEYKNKRSFAEYGLTPFLTSQPNLVDYISGGANGNGEYLVNQSNLVRQKHMVNGFGGGILSVNYTGRKLDATVGAAANRYAGEHFGQVKWIKNYIGNLDPDHKYYTNETDKRDYNAFVRANYEVVKGLNIYADLQWRYIHHKIWGVNDKYDWRDEYMEMQPLNVNKKYIFFTPKAGIFYTINDSHNIYASFAAAHKEPTRNNFTDILNGPTPHPEQLFDYELGYNYRGKVFSAGINLYYMDYNNQLVLTGQTNEIGEAMSANVKKSYRTGVELTAGVQITDWLRWDLNATLSRNIIKDYVEYLDEFDRNWKELGSQKTQAVGDVTIAYSPSVIAGSLISVNFGNFGAALQTQFVSSQYVTNSMQDGIWDKEAGDWSLDPLKLDAYCVSNLRLNYTFKFKGVKALDLGIAVNNIFNAKYCSNGWGYSALVADGAGGQYRYNEMGYYPQATINAIGSITLRF